ncbi:MAG: hypothetical protein HY292_04900 [Planctomycetes bacterium]|nr:hypothetical protein [Planctomycetota bacterium]
MLSRRGSRFLVAPLCVVALLGAVATAGAQSGFLNFEPSQVKPLALVGSRLLAVHTQDATLVVYDLDHGHRIVDEIRVGLDPVSVRPRPGHANEVWVVNALSDDVSVVDLSLGITVATIPIGDEPADVAFNRDGSKAYVTVGERDEVAVVDANARAVTTRIAIPAASPRTIERVPNSRFIALSAFKSGNHTTILPAAQAPPTNPQVGLIIPDSDPRSSVHLDDVDVMGIDTATDTLLAARVTGVGTILFGMGFHPTNGHLYVTNTEARNLVQYEPNVRGHIVDNRVTIVSGVAGGVTVQPVDLNPTVDYSLLPNPAAQATSLAQPTDIAFDRATGKAYVAAFGSAFVGVLDESGAILSRIPVGMGPRGLAVRTEARRLYCLNRLDDTISEIDLTTERVVSVFAIGLLDPTPEVIRKGRRFLYDARLTSGNGTASCASCHVDGDTDMLAWDLGDPNGVAVQGPPSPTPDHSPTLFEPLKGPMTTQTLRGLAPVAPYHWRGDRPTFRDFNPAFVSLMGLGQSLSADDMQSFEDFVFTIEFPPNPNMGPDRTYTGRAVQGLATFNDTTLFGTTVACSSCHELPFGTFVGGVVGRTTLQPFSQDFKVAVLRPAHHKIGRFAKTGFGFVNDGEFQTIPEFLGLSPLFPPFTQTVKDDLAEFIRQFDTGNAPSLGRELVVDSANASLAATTTAVTDLMVEASRAQVDLVVRGLFDGQRHGLWWNPLRSRFESDDSQRRAATWGELRNAAATGRARFLVQGVAAGSGPRMSIDRDSDALPDLDEARLHTSPIDPDTDRDGWLDGFEVIEHSNPLDAGSTPLSLTAPIIHGVSTPAARPYDVLSVYYRRIAFAATGVLPGAVVEVATSSREHFVLPIVPTAPGEWTTAKVFRGQDVLVGAQGWTFVLRNPTGAASPPFTAP